VPSAEAARTETASTHALPCAPLQASARGEHCLQLVRELEELRRAQGEREERSSKALVQVTRPLVSSGPASDAAHKQLAKGTAELESNERRRRVALDSSRLGACTVQRVGAVLQEVCDSFCSWPART